MNPFIPNDENDEYHQMRLLPVEPVAEVTVPPLWQKMPDGRAMRIVWMGEESRNAMKAVFLWTDAAAAESGSVLHLPTVLVLFGLWRDAVRGLDTNLAEAMVPVRTEAAARAKSEGAR